MTIIAAILDKPNKKGIIASDSMGSNGYSGIDFGSKLIRINEDFVVGHSGTYIIATWLKYEGLKLVDNNDTPDNILYKLSTEYRKACKDVLHHGNKENEVWMISDYLLGVTPDSILEVSRDGAILEVDKAYHAIGSGESIALGALEMASRLKIEPSIAVSQAISIAMLINPYCGGNIHIQMVG